MCRHFMKNDYFMFVFLQLGEELKHQGDIEKDEDAIDRMNDNMALDDKKPEAAYKIEESEGI